VTIPNPKTKQEGQLRDVMLVNQHGCDEATLQDV
jgi:hypothetical protein